MSWYIGAEGWHGTYTLEDGAIHAQLSSDQDQATQLWSFRITAKNEAATLEMAYQDMTLYWEKTSNQLDAQPVISICVLILSENEKGCQSDGPLRPTN